MAHMIEPRSTGLLRMIGLTSLLACCLAAASASAQQVLGLIYYIGKGVSQDPSQGVL